MDEHGKVGRRFVATRADQRAEIFVLQIGRARLAGLEGANPIEVVVDTGHREAGAGEFDRQRQTHVPLADDGDPGASVRDAVSKR